MTEALRPAEVLRRAASYLERHGVQSPTATAELLMASVLQTDRSELHRRQEGLSSAEAKLFGRSLCRRCSGTPVQHITGETGFRRLLLEVRPGVFVPRPETEIVVEVALKILSDRAPGSRVVVDVGTGTGAIALSIKDELSTVRVLATDTSPEAVALARQNSTSLGLAIEVFEGMLLEPIPRELKGTLTAVVSNPPYVASGSASSLPIEVLADPPSALFGDMGTYRELFAAGFDWLGPGGAVVVEIDPGIANEVLAEAGAAGFTEILVEPDLNGRDRVLSALKPAGAVE